MYVVGDGEFEGVPVGVTGTIASTIREKEGFLREGEGVCQFHVVARENEGLLRGGPRMSSVHYIDSEAITTCSL